MSEQLGGNASPAFRTVVASLDGGLSQTPPKLPEDDFDWQLVQSIARRHHVVPLVYEGLSKTDATPDLNPLREEVHENTKRNLQLTKKLIRVLEILEDHGIRAIPFKGPVLAVLAYGDSNRRTFTDLDLLVHPDDMVEAGRVLRANGYAPEEKFDVLLRRGHGSPLLADLRECSFHSPTHGEIDLQWKHGHWTSPLEVSFDEWWRRRETATLADHDVPVLSPEDRVLILATHGNKHAWRRLTWIADVPVSLESHDIDWEALYRRASSWNVEVALNVAILLGDVLFESSTEAIPTSVLSSARDDRRAVALAERATTRLATNPLDTPKRLEEVAYDLIATGSVRQMMHVPMRVTAASVRKMTQFGGRA